MNAMSSVAALVLITVAGVLPAAEPPVGQHNATSPAAASERIPQQLTLGLSDLMTMLVEPRHSKLFHAGRAGNWELAAFELRQLRASLRRISGVIPRYRDRDMEETVTALLEPQLVDTERAIASGDRARFTKAFTELTAACNACHTYLEHPFVVMKVPTDGQRSDHPTQEFRVMPE